MSVMMCELCCHYVDTDSDPDSLYVVGYDDKCVCDRCREDEGLKLEGEDDEPTGVEWVRLPLDPIGGLNRENRD